MKQPILVTGVERSGSSLIAKVLLLAGAKGGKLTNMYENVGVRLALANLYRDMGVDPSGQFPLPDPDMVEGLLRMNHRFEVSLRKENINENDVWFLKTSRILQTWQLFHKSYPDARWIIVRRRTGDIVNSCVKTAFMRAYADSQVLQSLNLESEEEGWKWWIRWHEQRIEELIKQQCQYKVIWPDRMVDGDFSQIYEMLEWIGLEWSDRIVSCIEPLLYKAKRKENKWQQEQPLKK